MELSTMAAHLIAIACSDAPDGHDHWPLRLLGQKMVELGYVEHISPETVRQALGKRRVQSVAARSVVSAPGRRDVCGGDGGRAGAVGRALRPGTPARSDFAYVRCGTANVFVCVEPPRRYRHITTTDLRTKQDYARITQWLIDEAYPEVEVNQLGQDNLSNHLPGSLYDAFEPGRGTAAPAEAGVPLHPCTRQLVEHGRDRVRHHRVGALPSAARRPSNTGATHRGPGGRAKRAGATITWSFTAYDARPKLRRLYPISQVEALTGESTRQPY